MLPSTAVELALAGAALVAAVVAGTTFHELSHALALTASGVPCRITVRPDRDVSGLLGANLPGSWATVTPTAIPGGFSAWQLRTAAMMPFILAAPFLLVVAGLAPNPFVAGGLPLQAAAIGWLGCALPSPRDFSLLWYPEEAIASRRDAAVQPGD